MHAYSRYALTRLSQSQARIPRSFYRNVSLRRAIGDGIRRTGSAQNNIEQRWIRNRDNDRREQRAGNNATPVRPNNQRRRDLPEDAAEQIALGRTSEQKSFGDTRADHLHDNRSRNARRFPSDIDDQAPLALPYTNAATEFVYGTFAVLAALKANRRKFHQLFLWSGSDASPIDADQQAIIKAANWRRVPIKKVAGNWDKVLDKLAGRRPHNGFILETSRLPMIPANSLTKLGHIDDGLEVKHASIDKETKSEFKVHFSSNDTCVFSKSEVRKRRYPLLLFLDRITDPGNMGAIFRTAHFLGVEAVIVPEHGTAPLSPVTVKASAGALEHIPILSVRNEIQFMRSSQEQGWSFIAAGINESSSARSRRSGKDETQDKINPYALLREGPCVLMLGNEGTGLRRTLQNLADFSIVVPHSGRRNDDIDSLNVSVAAGLLMDRFLLKNEDVLVRRNHNSEWARAGQQTDTTEDGPGTPDAHVENTMF